MSITGGGGLARVPNLRVCEHLHASRWHTQGGKDELTSCRGTVKSAWQKPPVILKGGRAELPARVSGRHVVRGRQSSPAPEVRQEEQARLVKTVNIQVKPGQDRRLPSVATHTQGSSERPAFDLGWEIVLQDGSWVAIHCITGRSYFSPHGDGSMYSQANVRVESVLRPLPERCRPWPGTLKRCFGKRMGPWSLSRLDRTRMVRCSPRGAPLEPTGRLRAGGARRTQADYWNIDGSRDLSDPWTGFTQFTQLEEKPPEGYMWSGRRLTRKQLTSRPDHLWPELWKSIGKHAKLKEKQKWSNEKLHLEKRTKIAWDLFHRPRGYGIQRNHQERA